MKIFAKFAQFHFLTGNHSDHVLSQDSRLFDLLLRFLCGVDSRLETRKQCLSSHPEIAEMSFSLAPFVILETDEAGGSTAFVISSFLYPMEINDTGYILFLT